METLISNCATKTNNAGPQNNSNVNKPKSAMDKSIGVYSFDDLLVSCTQEIIANGFNTEQIPGLP